MGLFSAVNCGIANFAASAIERAQVAFGDGCTITGAAGRAANARTVSLSSQVSSIRSSVSESESECVSKKGRKKAVEETD